MSDPVLHLIAGPNGAGKSTLFERVIEPATHLEFINADIIAFERWPGDTSKSYEAAALAADRRAERMDSRKSFATEMVFSHPSKVDFVRAAIDAGYLLTLHVVMVPEDLAVARVANRVEVGGHSVPEEKVRQRYGRLWSFIASAIKVADTTVVYDNSRSEEPFRVVATFQHGSIVGSPDWPPWVSEAVRSTTQ